MTVNCKICGQHFSKTVSANHLKKHNITRREYQEKYSAAPQTSSEVINRPRTRPVREPKKNQPRTATVKPVETITPAPTVAEPAQPAQPVQPVVEPVAERPAPPIEPATQLVRESGTRRGILERIISWVKKIFGISDK